MLWYLRSPANGDTHRGTMDRGRVHAACGIQFVPYRRKALADLSTS
ncbi:MAG: hypothetical protein M3460_05850 [Actinomycetota bacterium]|nr:hypothetical protein [Actinomycetota bacterium]